MAPISILATEAQSSILSRTSHRINYIFYVSWLQNLDKDNFIRVIYAENNIFWCNKIDSCTVENKDAHNKTLHLTAYRGFRRARAANELKRYV